MIRFIGLFTIFLSAALLSAPGVEAKDVLRIATEGAYPPFNSKTADGELVGFDVEIAKALCAQMERECRIVAQDWDGMIPGLVRNKYDAIVASMSITPEREKTVDFSNRYYSNYLRFVAKKERFMAKKDQALMPEDFKSKTVGAQRSTIAGQWLEDNLASQARVKLYDTQTAAYSDLTSGRLDALISDFLPAYDWLQDNQDFVFIGDQIDVGDRIGIALRKGDSALQKDLNAAITAIRADGTYAAINARYFPFDIY